MAKHTPLWAWISPTASGDGCEIRGQYERGKEGCWALWFPRRLLVLTFFDFMTCQVGKWHAMRLCSFTPTGSVLPPYLLLGSQPSSMKRKGEMLLTRKKNRARKMVSLVLFPGFGMPLLQQAKLSLVCGLLFSPVAFLHVLEGAAPSLAAFSPSSSSTPTSSKLNKGPQLFNSQGFPVEN